MDSDELEHVLAGLLRLLEAHTETIGDLVDLSKTHGRTIRAVDATLDDVQADLIDLRRTLGFLANMKAATLTMACSKCGAVYAKEPGPELCGPCWVAAGRPGTLGLYLVPPPATDGGNHGATA